MESVYDKMSSTSATVVITTKNRRDGLAAALKSALSQTLPIEIMVVDDGSTDGTSEMVRSEFPSVRLERSEQSRGCVFQRNRAAEIAHGEILFSIDDDALFASPRTVEQTLREFVDPRIGAIAIPLLEAHKSSAVRQQAPAGEEIFVTDTFIGTSYAVRRDVFAQLGGYREYLVHQGEEMDFCLRMLAAGYVVRLGGADAIHHLESLARDFGRMSFYGRRNDILFAWNNVPWPFFLIHLLGTTWNGLKAVWQRGHTSAMLLGMTCGYVDCLRYWNKRGPVSPGIYKLNRLLRKKGPIPLEEVKAFLNEIIP